MTAYPYSQQIHLPHWLSEVIHSDLKGCLRIFSASTAWSLHMEAGKLVYASSSIEPFDRLDRHLSRYLSTLYHSLREPLRSRLFDPNFSIPNPDYQAICWLVRQNYLSSERAALLVRDLARETIESLLFVEQIERASVESDEIASFPKFCHLDLLSLIRSCQSPQILPAQTQLPPNQAIWSSPPAPAVSSISVPSPAISDRHPSIENPKAAVSSRAYTIACIDDNPSIVRVIRSYLDDDRFSVLAIDDPVKALMQIVRHKPDIVLLDVEMPKLDGYELCSLLRRHPMFKKIPIVMVTGNTGFIDRAKAKLVRASDYLTKPFTKEQLTDVILKHLP